jgi:hypothetical protein
MTSAAAQSSPAAAPEWPIAGRNIGSTHFQAAGQAPANNNKVYAFAPVG